MTSGFPGCWGVCWHSCGSVGIPTRSAWLPLPCQPKPPAFPFFNAEVQSLGMTFSLAKWIHAMMSVSKMTFLDSGEIPHFRTSLRTRMVNQQGQMMFFLKKLFQHFLSTCFHVSTNVSTFFSTNLWPWLQKTSPSWSPMWCTRSTPGRAGLSGPAMAMKMMHGTWTWRHGAKSLVSATY